MKLPLSWIAHHLEAELDVDALVDVMSLHGLEVEEVTRPGDGVSGVRTAKVLAHRPHPDADKLRLVDVTGEHGQGHVEVVCGASNFDVGDVVVHAPPGSTIPGMTLEARELRGVVSNGMLCSPRELGLGDDHAGLLILEDTTPVGVALQEVLPVGEPVIEIAVQPDRGDHLGILGVARDLAAVLGATWRDLDVSPVAGGNSVDVTLDTPRCASFVTWELRGVTVGPSPSWMRQRLLQCGIRPIDVIVDVTNYVMLETGQPLHAFDLDTLRGRRLHVREAVAGETLVTLDDVERDLVVGDLVIDDAERIVSLAGVMGGLDTEVTSATTNVLIEAAVWDPRSVRATSRRLGLVSEASMRFERRVDPAGAQRAAARAAQLIEQFAGGKVGGSQIVDADVTPPFAAPVEIVVSPARVAGLLGVPTLDASQQQQLLERSGCTVVAAGEQLTVVPPSWRGDLTRPADLAEEVARLHGYDRIPAVVPTVATTGGRTAPQKAVREIRQIMLAHGFDEALSRPFVGDDGLVALSPGTAAVRLSNPLAKDAAAMRPSMVEGLLRAVRHNTGQGRPGVALGEIGRVFRPVEDPLVDVLTALERTGLGGQWSWCGPQGEPLPVQPRVLGLAAQGVAIGSGWLDPERPASVYDLLAVFDRVIETLAGVPGELALERVTVARHGFHPGRSASLTVAGVEVGFVGQLHPHEADRRDLPEPVVVGELLIEPFLTAMPDGGFAPRQARRLARHPAMTIDVGLVAPDEVPFSQLAAMVVDGAGGLLDEWWWFDEYRGEQVGEGHRSVAMRLRLHHPDRQLTDADAETVIEQIAAKATAGGVRLRR